MGYVGPVVNPEGNAPLVGGGAVRAQLLSSMGTSPFENVAHCYQIFKLFRGSCSFGFSCEISQFLNVESL